MDSMLAFAMGEANRGKPSMVFDWDKAARIIKSYGAKEASAGLSGDWEYTGGPILRDGQPVPADDTYTFLASTWATPELEVDGETIDCWRYQTGDDDCDSGTYWPESALTILRGEES
jgi:hypothetical protein